MKTVNSLSGGRTSSYMAVHYPADINIFACVCIDWPKSTPKDPEILKYCMDKLNGNFIASSESVKTLKLMMQLEQKLGKEIVWVRGKSFDQIIDEAGCLPTWVRRFCTTQMKITPIFEHIYFRYGIVKERIGFRYDESNRAYKTKKEESILELMDLFGDIEKVKLFIKEKYRNVDSIMVDYPMSTNVFGKKRNNLSNVLWAKKEYPLIDDKIERIHVGKYWSQFPELDFPNESNCAGCPNKSPESIKTQFIDEPEIMEWFALQETKKMNLGAKCHTWHDDVIPYSIKKDLSFTELLELGGWGSCNTGYCNDD